MGVRSAEVRSQKVRLHRFPKWILLARVDAKPATSGSRVQLFRLNLKSVQGSLKLKVDGGIPLTAGLFTSTIHLVN